MNIFWKIWLLTGYHVEKVASFVILFLRYIKFDEKLMYVPITCNETRMSTSISRGAQKNNFAFLTNWIKKWVLARAIFAGIYDIYIFVSWRIGFITDKVIHYNYIFEITALFLVTDGWIYKITYGVASQLKMHYILFTQNWCKRCAEMKFIKKSIFKLQNSSFYKTLFYDINFRFSRII